MGRWGWIGAAALMLIATAAYAATYYYDTTFQGRLVVRASSTAPACSSAAAKGDLCIGNDAQVVDDLTVGDDLLVSGEITGLVKMIAGAAAYTVVAPTDCGGVVTTATDNAVITLPAAAAANAGCRVTVINTGADGAAKVSISPAAADGIYGSCAGVTGAGAATVIAASGTDDKDWINTKATANKGDHSTLVSDGSNGWYIVGCVGEWASE